MSEHVSMDLLDHYEVIAYLGGTESKPLAGWFCRPCNHMQVIARDLEGSQDGLTLGEMAESVLEHQREAHESDPQGVWPEDEETAI